VPYSRQLGQILPLPASQQIIASDRQRHQPLDSWHAPGG